MEIISRSEAKVLGLKRYFTGIPCKHGHMSERKVGDRSCLECKAIRYSANQEAIVQRACKWQKENRERRHEITKRWRSANYDKIRESASAYRAKKRDDLRRKSRDYYKMNKKDRLQYYRNYSVTNPDKRKAARTKWSKANPHKEREKGARSLASKRNATPPWLTKDHKRAIVGFYAVAIMHERLTGTPHHVDHIQPIQGTDRRGLHVPWNLQVLPGRLNQSKGNRTQAKAPA